MTPTTLRRDELFSWDEPFGTGEDANFVINQRNKIADHYYMPVSRLKYNIASKFYDLKKEWEAETGYLSSVTEIAMNPAYQHIIGMGQAAIPYILSELKVRSGHWFWALKAITGEDPVLPEQRGRIKQMAEAWLEWGRQRGYLV